MARGRRTRQRIAREPGDTLAAVRNKERLLEQLNDPASSLSQWKAVAGLWCAYWFWQGDARPPVSAFGALTDVLRGGKPSLPARLMDKWLAESRAA